MTNEIYYGVKNPISHIAFANWLHRQYTMSYTTRNNNLGWMKVEMLDDLNEYTTVELFRLWCKLLVDKSLAIDEIKLDGDE